MFRDRVQAARLTLRPITPADATPIFERYARDPEVTRYLSRLPHTGIEQTESYAPHCLGFGYVRARSCCGLGLMTEALTEVTSRALEQPDIWRIGDVENLASARVMEKADP
jgi:RimJ/RimL family protein N-acetyltransferase